MQPRGCPSEVDLLNAALERRDSLSSVANVIAHVKGCARCQQELLDLRRAVVELRTDASRVPDGSENCLDDETVALLAEGLGDGRAPGVAVAHLAECNSCSARVAGVSQLLRNADVVTALRHLDAPSRKWSAGWRFAFPAGMAAAAALAFVAFARDHDTDRELQFREEAMTLISAPVPIQPVGIVSRVDSLSWFAQPRATQYRLTFFAQDGSTIWETGGITDTAVALPPGISLARGVYFWKVEARTDWNRWTASEMVEVRVGGAR